MQMFSQRIKKIFFFTLSPNYRKFRITEVRIRYVLLYWFKWLKVKGFIWCYQVRWTWYKFCVKTADLAEIAFLIPHYTLTTSGIHGISKTQCTLYTVNTQHTFINKYKYVQQYKIFILFLLQTFYVTKICYSSQNPYKMTKPQLWVILIILQAAVFKYSFHWKSHFLCNFVLIQYCIMVLY